MTESMTIEATDLADEGASEAHGDWIRRAAEVCHAATRGDLEPRILHIDAEGDLGELLHAINHLLDLTDAFVREVGTSLEYASEGKTFRRVLPEGLLGSFSRAAQSINKVTRTMGRKTSELRAAEQRRLSLEKEFRGIIDVVRGFRDSSKEIGEVVGTIQRIAKQTNLLALNASIEAARAGVAGRGFAVVANQVKNLADETSTATSTIHKQVEASQSATDEVVVAIERIWRTVCETGVSP